MLDTHERRGTPIRRLLHVSPAPCSRHLVARSCHQRRTIRRPTEDQWCGAETARRLQCAGHCARSDELAADAVLWQPNGNRNRGRPAHTYRWLLEKDTGLCTQELRTAMLSRTNWWYHVMGSGEPPDWLIVNKINGKMWDDVINSLICIISTVQEMFRWKLQKFRMSYLPYLLSDWHQFFPLLFEVFLLFLLN